MRPRVSVYIATSLDQFIARPDGGLDWLDTVLQPGEDYGYAAFMATVDTLVVGRATYDTVLGFGEWPYTGKRVAVLTHRPFVPQFGEELCSGALVPILNRLGTEGVRHVYLDGGNAVRQGLAEGVVDELTLSIVPRLLGRGRPLFGDIVPEVSWTLVSSRSFPTGLVQLRYTIARDR